MSGLRRRSAAIGIRFRSGMMLTVASVAGVAIFTWPLLADAGSELGQSRSAPLVLAMILPLVVAVVLAELSNGRLDAKAVAMLGVLSACGAVLRPLGAGTAGIELVFFLLVLGGRVYGPGFGFVLGSTTLFASALVTGGVGPWLPYQMLAASFVGLGAGLLPPARGRIELLMLAGYGALSALLYGVAMTLSFWPFTLGADTELSYVAGAAVVENLHRFAIFTLTTSLGWDIGRAITNVVLILLLGPAVLATLRRASHRAAFGAPVTFESVPEGETMAPTPLPDSQTPEPTITPSV